MYDEVGGRVLSSSEFRRVERGSSMRSWASRSLGTGAKDSLRDVEAADDVEKVGLKVEGGTFEASVGRDEGCASRVLDAPSLGLLAFSFALVVRSRANCDSSIKDWRATQIRL